MTNDDNVTVTRAWVEDTIRHLDWRIEWIALTKGGGDES